MPKVPTTGRIIAASPGRKHLSRARRVCETCARITLMEAGIDRSPDISVPLHFGEFLQGRDAEGRLLLVTLPCPAAALHVWRDDGPFALIQPDAALLRETEARALFEQLGIAAQGRFTLRSDLPPGAGAGVSTAALVALARAAGSVATPERLARACIAVEGASDPLMYPAPGRLLWASRDLGPVADLPALPPLEVLGGFWGPPRRTDPADLDFPEIGDLLAAWPAACADPLQLARLAAASARRCLARRGPAGDPTEALAERLGAAGFAIAHTGSARALLFLPGTVPEGAARHLEAAGLNTILQFRTGG